MAGGKKTVKPYGSPQNTISESLSFKSKNSSKALYPTTNKITLITN